VTGKIAQLVVIRDALEQLVATCQQPREQRRCPLLEDIDRISR